MTDEPIPTDHIDSFLADLTSKGTVVDAPKAPAAPAEDKFGMAGAEPALDLFVNPGGEDPVQSEGKLDEILGRLDPDDDSEAPAQAWQKPAEPEQVFKDPDAEDEPEAAEAEAEAAPAEPVDKEQLQAALTALTRDGLPESVLDGMDQSTLLEIGTKAKDRQAHADELARQNAELQKPPSEPTPAESRVAPSDDPLVDFDSLVQPLVEEIGEDAASAVIPLVREVVSQATKQATQEIKGLQSVVPALQRQLLQVLTERARDQLSPDYPRLADPAMWATVQERMGALARSGDYDDPAILLSHACRIEMPGSTKPKRSRASSQPTPPRSGKSRKRPSRDEADARILKHLDSGMSAKEARAAAYRE